VNDSKEDDMNIGEARARLKARAWRALVQGDVDVKSLDQESLDNIISVIADAALMELDEEIVGSLKGTASPTETFDAADERVLWEGRPFLSLNTAYVVTNERVRVIEGVLGKDRQDIELIRIQDIDQSQSVSERLLNLGDIHIQSHDSSHPQMTLRNVKDPTEVHETLRRAVLEARKRHKLSYREEM
jgi:hypothetical protein